ncbi:hypothetical protein HDU93_003615 [Gonapodya sp. JEL0774]|nr:hypothetical protein HDU93_003615 [Gonapodya sp. JEL0774]
MLLTFGLNWEYLFGANRRFPPDARSALRTAVYHHKYSSDPQLAIQHYRKAHAACIAAGYSPTSPEVTGILLELGELYERLGRPRRAVQVYETVWKLLVVDSEVPNSSDVSLDPAPMATTGLFGAPAYVGVTEPRSERMNKAVNVAVKISEIVRKLKDEGGGTSSKRPPYQPVSTPPSSIQVSTSAAKALSSTATASEPAVITSSENKPTDLEKAERYIGWAIRTLLGATTEIESRIQGEEQGKDTMVPAMHYAPETETLESSSLSRDPSLALPSNPTSTTLPPPETSVASWSTPHQLSLVLESAASLYAWHTSPRQYYVAYPTLLHALRLSELHPPDASTHADPGDEVCRQAAMMCALAEMADGMDKRDPGGSQDDFASAKAYYTKSIDHANRMRHEDVKAYAQAGLARVAAKEYARKKRREVARGSGGHSG